MTTNTVTGNETGQASKTMNDKKVLVYTFAFFVATLSYIATDILIHVYLI